MFVEKNLFYNTAMDLKLRANSATRKGWVSSMKTKRTTRWISLILAALLAAGTAGCSSAQSGTESGQSQPQSQGETNSAGGETESGDVTTLSWFSDVTGWGPSGWDSSVTSSPLLDAIESDIGLTFQIEQPPTDADTKLGLMIASGELPDLISVTDTDIINQLIDSGKVWDLQTFLEQYAPDSHLLSDFPEDIKQALVDKFGGWYTYPSHMNSADSRKLFPPSDPIYEATSTKGANGAIMFNLSIMEDLGITQDDVMTESGFYAACQKILDEGYTVNGKPVLPLILQADSWIGTSLDDILAGDFGAVPVDEEGNYRHLELSPAYYDALKFLNTCINSGYLDVNTLTIDETALNSYLENGQVFCWIGNSAQFQKKQTIPFDSFGPILSDSGARPTIRIEQQAGTGWIQTLVSTDCQSPEKIAELLTFASSKEGMLLNDYGTEGEDYTIDENGIVTRTEEGQSRFENEYKMNIALWPFANTAFSWSTTMPESEEVARQSDSGLWTYISTAMGTYKDTYVYDGSLLTFLGGTVIEPSSDLGINLSQIESYLDSQKAKIVTAPDEATFEAEYNNMISTLESYNVADIDSEYNTLYQKNCEKYNTSIEDVNKDIFQ